MKSKRIGWIVFFVVFDVLLMANLARGEDRPQISEELVRLRAAQIELKEKEQKLQKELEKKDTPAMKEARKQLQKEAESRAKAEKKAMTAFNSLGLTGCRTPAETSAVVVNPAVGNSWGLRKSVRESTMELTIVNQSGQPIAIRDNSQAEPLVDNLCSGGTIKLTFSVSTMSPNNKEVNLTAIGQSLGAGTTVETRRLSLYRSSDWQNRQNYGETWTIELR